ncbi:hypothetical protein ACTQ50_10645 [Blautia sp. Sow4_E7]|uniref:hypothetical protein n=1 Tax=Blautia sp. Sow4_E7 TaxID=3438749 RepID=UPI003F9397BC
MPECKGNYELRIAEECRDTGICGPFLCCKDETKAVLRVLFVIVGTIKVWLVACENKNGSPEIPGLP